MRIQKLCWVLVVTIHWWCQQPQFYFGAFSMHDKNLVTCLGVVKVRDAKCDFLGLLEAIILTEYIQFDYTWLIISYNHLWVLSGTSMACVDNMRHLDVDKSLFRASLVQIMRSGSVNNKTEEVKRLFVQFIFQYLCSNGFSLIGIRLLDTNIAFVSWSPTSDRCASRNYRPMKYFIKFKCQLYARLDITL